MKAVLLIFLSFATFALYGQSTSRTIHVEEVGTLKNYLTEEDKSTITDLTLTGYINGDDVVAIRSIQNLSSLDLRNLNIRKGGKFTSGPYPSTIREDNSIASFMFCWLDNLQSIILPENATFIGESAFEDCKSLSYVELGPKIDSIATSAFYVCSSLKSMNFPESLKCIKSQAFSGCGFEELVVPRSITKIESSVFAACNIKKLTIYDNIQTIEFQAFRTCTDLKDIYWIGTNPTVIESRSAFEVWDDPDAIYDNCTLHVPKGYGLYFSIMMYWKDFKTIVEYDPTSITDSQIDDDVKVYADLDKIVVKGLNAGQSVIIYNSFGVLIKDLKSSNDEIEFSLPVNQLYLVKVGNKTTKVTL